MTNTPSLTAYRFRVVLGNPDDDDSLIEHHVTAFGRDIQQVERLFADRKWGSTQDRPITAAAGAAYYALTRKGWFDGSFDDFEAAYIEVAADEPAAVSIRPTERVPTPA
jgi:hypothetical protein